MNKPTVILPVETKSREFHGKLFLALNLLARGYPVVIGEQWRLWEYADLLSPGIYIDKSIAATHIEWIQRCNAMGHVVTSWDEEGLIFFEPWMYRKLRVEPKSMEGLARLFAWGEVQREAICEEYPDYYDRIALCGNPRFDLLRPKLRDFYRDAVDSIKQRYGKMLLVNTNFAMYNHYKTPEQLREALAHYPLAQEPGYMDGWIAMHKHAHEAYLAMVPELLARYPDHTVVVRPHPSENHAPWEALAEQHPRLFVDASGNVHEWILASECVIHFNCTTAVEAYLLDVPAIAYRPGRYPRYENPLPYALSENTFSLPELFAAVDGRFTARERGVLWTAEQQAIATRYIASVQGGTAAERITNELDTLVKQRPWRRFSPLDRLLARAKHSWRLRIHAQRESSRGTDGYNAQKFPGLTAAELEEDLNRMMAASAIHVNATRQSVAKNCFRLIPGEPRR